MNNDAGPPPRRPAARREWSQRARSGSLPPQATPRPTGETGPSQRGWRRRRAASAEDDRPGGGDPVTGRTWTEAINERIGRGRAGSGGQHRWRRQWPLVGRRDPGNIGDHAETRKAKLLKRLVASAAVLLMLTGVGLVAATYFVDGVPTPDQLPLPESTTVYYADGKTVMARLGSETRTNLDFDEMNDPVKEAAVAAEDRTFWTNEGIDFSAVMRAAWNNVTGGDGGRQGGSTIAQQYARSILDAREATYSRKLREAVVAWKLTDKYSKEKILEFYLNTVPFGRGAYGIEAAAQAYFGKTADKNAKPERQITVSEAAMLVANIKQPEPDPNNPVEAAGYDPKRTKNEQQNANALANSTQRWGYVLDALVELGNLTSDERAKLVYPLETLKTQDPASAGLDQPTGLVVEHALSELAQSPAFQGKSWDYIRNSGFQIITTVHKGAQDAATRAADKVVKSSPMYAQSRKYQAALVAIEPGTGRVLAYFGGHNGAGVDYAGWYRDEDGDPKGRGSHPPGSSFKVYTLAAALRDGISLNSRWDSSSPHEFPPRRVGANAVRNSSACTREYGEPNGPCTLLGSTVSSLNVPFYALTEAIGQAKVVEMARDAGIQSMWTDDRTRVDFTAETDITGQGRQHFDTEVGFGQYPVTVLDHANGLATFAADGLRAAAHFVKAVFKGKDVVYGEALPGGDQLRVLTEPQSRDLTYALSLTSAAHLGNGWDSAGKTGTWQYAKSASENAHGWMVGFTKKLAAAVWVGNEKDEAPVRLKDGSKLYGANLPAAIWRQFMAGATQKMGLKNDSSARFGEPAWTGDAGRGTVEKPPKGPRNRDRDRGGGGGGGDARHSFDSSDALAVDPAIAATIIAAGGRLRTVGRKVEDVGPRLVTPVTGGAPGTEF
jgi:membrane peptidoglycan carboxypeptidase